MKASPEFDREAREAKPPDLRARALGLLARREHSRAELLRKLDKTGAERDTLNTLLDELEARNWLSDRRFAESYVADHRARAGAIKLAFDLRQRGVADAVIHAVLDEQRDSERARALAVWQKKFGTPAHTPSERASQMRFLQGRGFTPEVIRQVVPGCSD